MCWYGPCLDHRGYVRHEADSGANGATRTPISEGAPLRANGPWLVAALGVLSCVLLSSACVGGPQPEPPSGDQRDAGYSAPSHDGGMRFVDAASQDSGFQDDELNYLDEIQRAGFGSDPSLDGVVSPFESGPSISLGVLFGIRDAGTRDAGPGEGGVLDGGDAPDAGERDAGDSD